jgi:hypothetical protein
MDRWRSWNLVAIAVYAVADGLPPIGIERVIRSTVPFETTLPLAATVPFRTFVTNNTAPLPISSAVISQGPFMPFSEIVPTGVPLLFRTMRQPAFVMAGVPSFVGKLPTVTNPERRATSAVVRPTPLGRGPGTDAASIFANRVTIPLDET